MISDILFSIRKSTNKSALFLLSMSITILFDLFLLLSMNEYPTFKSDIKTNMETLESLAFTLAMELLIISISMAYREKGEEEILNSLSDRRLLGKYVPFVSYQAIYAITGSLIGTVLYSLVYTLGYYYLADSSIKYEPFGKVAIIGILVVTLYFVLRSIAIAIHRFYLKDGRGRNYVTLLYALIAVFSFIFIKNPVFFLAFIASMVLLLKDIANYFLSRRMKGASIKSPSSLTYIFEEKNKITVYSFVILIVFSSIIYSVYTIRTYIGSVEYQKYDYRVETNRVMTDLAYLKSEEYDCILEYGDLEVSIDGNSTKVVFLDLSNLTSFYNVTYTEKDAISSNAIALSEYYRREFGYEIGDIIRINIDGKIKNLTVYAFFESDFRYIAFSNVVPGNHTTILIKKTQNSKAIDENIINGIRDTKDTLSDMKSSSMIKLLEGLLILLSIVAVMSITYWNVFNKELVGSKKKAHILKMMEFKDSVIERTLFYAELKMFASSSLISTIICVTAILSAKETMFALLRADMKTFSLADYIVYLISIILVVLVTLLMTYFVRRTSRKGIQYGN